MDIYTDEELEMMDQSAESGPGTAIVPAPPPIPLYPIPGLQQQQAMGAAPAGAQPVPNGQSPAGSVMNVMKRPMGPLPLWAWLLIGGGVVGTGYFALRRGGVEKNKSDESDSSSSSPSLGERIARAWSPPKSEPNKSGWSPSRSAFAESLQRYFDKKGQSAHVVVWHDADEAKQQGGMQFVSPLINIQVKGGGVKVDQALTRFCRREGLDPKAHTDGNIGLYPHTTKRGKEWEEYIDALRDDGQSV
jgi:hypothetical protein